MDGLIASGYDGTYTLTGVSSSGFTYTGTAGLPTSAVLSGASATSANGGFYGLVADWTDGGANDGYVKLYATTSNVSGNQPGNHGRDWPRHKQQHKRTSFEHHAGAYGSRHGAGERGVPWRGVCPDCAGPYGQHDQPGCFRVIFLGFRHGRHPRRDRNFGHHGLGQLRDHNQ